MNRPRPLGVLAALLAAAVLAGCGAEFKLPTETRTDRSVPSDGSYQMLATWTGMDGVKDILLTQAGSQLFILFNQGGTGLASRGTLRAYPLSRPEPVVGIEFPTLFNPVALCAGAGRLFVLDQGDTCIARANPATPGVCDPDFTGNGRRVSNLSAYWRVREYGLLGGDTVSTFTDTSMAHVEGIAADAQGRVYVSGTAILLDPQPDFPSIRTRKFVSVIVRYARGPRYPGVTPPDRNMPGAAWHRDTTWSVEQGQGFGNVVDPRGIYWGPYAGGGVYAAVYGRNYAQRFSDVISNGGDSPAMASAEDLPLESPVDAYADLQGFVYVVDEGNRRVLRYDADKSFVQRVDVEVDAQGQALLDPVAVAADDSLAYVADRGLGKVIRYKRRK